MSFGFRVLFTGLGGGARKTSSWGKRINQFTTALEIIPRSTVTEVKICFTIILQFKLV